MGKNDFLTSKAIANRIKVKGLQKLRWYCQMCQKQCRDDNGFKCHCMSESHQRQMQVFGMNPNRVIGGYTEEFEITFLDHMRRSRSFSRVVATVVYNEYISDRLHVHMTSTEWATLTEFVKYLGRTGKCKVEETPKGWFTTYIDRDSETIFKDRLKNKRVRSDLVEEERQERIIAQQIERAAALLPSTSISANENVNPPQSDAIQLPLVKSLEKIVFSIQPTSVASSKPVLVGDGVGIPRNDSSNLGFGDDPKPDGKVEKTKADAVNGNARGKSALHELMKEEEKAKEIKNRKGYWLCEGISAKVLSKTLEDKGYYKQKGVVRKVIDKTVNGTYRGSTARLLSVDTERFCAKVQIEKGVYDGRVLLAVDYEDIYGEIFGGGCRAQYECSKQLKALELRRSDPSLTDRSMVGKGGGIEVGDILWRQWCVEVSLPASGGDLDAGVASNTE
ncbi:hypothetical protein KSP39_PZI000085 [Platanthera zijinensis]|uniref:DNA/RNA-binding protein Kin17 WH-like domain-containing protein n=1 Tax=Platanthera zijinensis TaxID=2320716 RepID=A0AAP0C112_9ASPA